MRIVILGAGPAGLYCSLLIKKAHPLHEIVIIERNPADVTYGWGVVFSDRTLASFQRADYKTYEQLTEQFVIWDAIDVLYRGETIRCGGHIIASIARRTLLNILQRRCQELGITLIFGQTIHDLSELPEYDLLIAADGINSVVRRSYAEIFKPKITYGRARYIWLGANKILDAFTFIFRENEHGLFQVHAYPSSGTTSTFIVECDESSWLSAGLERADEEESLRYCEQLFASELAGAALLSNNSRWINFPTLSTQNWRHKNIVLLGDAAHTAHFSIGSGTKLAMEDALALAACLNENSGLDAALGAYEAERRPVVASTQRAAQASLEWFEDLGQYVHQDPEQFAFNIITRSRRVVRPAVRAARLRLRRGRAADVPAVLAPRPEPEEPGGRLGHGHVLGGRRHPVRLPPGPPRREGPRRCGPGDDRDGLRERAGPDHAGLRRAVRARARGRMGAHHRLRAPALDREDRPAAGPLRPEGLDPADVGGHGRAAGRGELAAGRPIAGPLPARGQPGPARADGRRDGRDQGAVRRGDPGRAARRVRPAGAALRPRLPAVLVHLPAHQPPGRPVRGRPGGAAALSAGGVHGHARGLARGPPDDGADIGHRLGGRRDRRAGRRGDRAGVRAGRGRRDRRLDRPGHAR